ncbi:MAG: glycosyltransferase family 1 protein [Magnetococcales bacterium]|nr:glycosyltransferase family 1 protein [Magnetococcales bacterium]
MKKIAIFLPSPSPFHRALLQQLTEAFTHLGLTVQGGTALLAEEKLLEFCRIFQPDVLFEMNRCRWEIPSLPSTIIHVSWIVDTLGRKMEQLGGSELLYFFGYNWFAGYPHKNGGIVDWLPPGSCRRTYHFDSWHEGIHPSSFVGHISFPWTRAELGRPLTAAPDPIIRFGDLLPVYEQSLDQTSQQGFANDDYVQLAIKSLKERFPVHPVLDKVLYYDIGCRVIRMRNRNQLLHLALSTRFAPVIHGTGGWEAWPEYRPFFKGPLEQPADVCRLYQNSRLNLHEGVGIHFRSMDCMSAGGILFYLASPDDDQPGGINTLFDPGTHFVSVTKENFIEHYHELMNQPEQRKTIAQQAAREIHAHHTWEHRAAKIMADLNR